MKTEKRIAKLEQMIKAKREEIVRKIIGIEPCAAHIYQRNVRGVAKCIFCDRLAHEIW